MKKPEDQRICFDPLVCYFVHPLLRAESPAHDPGAPGSPGL